MTIDEIRKALGDRNLAEVGRRLGVSRAYLNSIRDGSVTPINTAMGARLADYLNGGSIEKSVSSQYAVLISQVIDCINLEWEKEEGAITDEIYYSENITLLEHIAERLTEIGAFKNV